MIASLLAAQLPAPHRLHGSFEVPGLSAIVLAAGEGRRLRPLTETLAKPLAPVLNIPLLYWNVVLLHGCTNRLAINASYLAEQLTLASRSLGRLLGNAPAVVEETMLSGPAGGMLAARRALSAGTDFLVVSGDALIGEDCHDLVAAHRSSGADLTIAAKPVEDPRRFGVLELDGADIVGLREKPADAPPGSVVSCGMYVIGDRAAALLRPEPGALYDFKHVVPELLAAGLSVRAHVQEGHWSDVGDMAALHAANLFALRSGLLERAATPGTDAHGAWTQGAVTTARDLDVTGPVCLGAEARIGPECAVERSVVGPHARVGAGSRLRDAVLLHGARVPPGADIDHAVVIGDRVLPLPREVALT
ncbi:sugar phosphate nucleotidyltransferase [Streptomyces sp. NPDC091287]|uniref:sugar phosphate nucleotidyltransferase n=1 Tax=Streptomyces sp. NPDC091287 TaxID=3365988 RepID=UPI00381EA399